MSYYKVDSEKGFKILCATSPSVIFVNGIRFSEINDFVDKFKSTDFDLLNVENIYGRMANRFDTPKEDIYDYFADASQFGDHPEWEASLVGELHTFLNRFRTAPCVIYGDIGAVGLITKIFNDEHAVFSYVYIYPNSASEYKKTVSKFLESNTMISTKISELVKKRKDKDFEKHLDMFVKHMLDSRKKTFKLHTEALGKALVILSP